MELTGRYGIDDLLALANTRHGPAAHPFVRRADGPLHDHLARGSDARAFLVEHGMTDVPSRAPTRAELARLRPVRDAVHRLLERPEARREALAALLAPARFSLDADRRLRAQGRGWSAVAMDLLAPLAELSEEGARLKRCGNPGCGWLFVDRSRNRSRQWCEMGSCGNRAKAARFRRRRSRGPATP